MNIITGRVWKYADNVNTDVIFPGKYTYTISTPEDMPAYALEDLDSRFANQVQPNDIIVAGKNWGCGSSREQAVVCLSEAKLGAIIAKSFARIYYRNCLNNALPAITNNDMFDGVNDGDEISIDLLNGKIYTKQKEYNFQPLPESVIELIKVGGLIEYTKIQLNK